MRKAWQIIFLLCMACIICMQGLCFAGDKDGKWVQYYREDDQNVYFVNEDYVNVQEYNGRKYLELAVKCKETKYENYVLVARAVLVTKYQCHKLYDVERNIGIIIKPNTDNLKVIEKKAAGGLLARDQALLQWAEKKYPALINEIKENNRNHPLSGQKNEPNMGAQTSSIRAFPVGNTITPPKTLPTDNTEETYESSGLYIPYTSQGYDGEEATFILSYENPKESIGYGGMVQQRPHGRYVMRNEVQVVAGIDDFSFDYDDASQTFTIYDGGGKEYTARYDQAENALIVNHLWDSARSGKYVYDPAVSGYIMYIGNHKIPPHVAALTTQPFAGDDDIGRRYEIEYRNGVVFEVIRNPKDLKNQDLPDMWYKMTKASNKEVWIAFTYDSENNLFTMYDSDNEGDIKKYAHRQFIDNNQIVNWQTDYPWDPNVPGELFTRTSLDDTFTSYTGWGTYIYKFITDGVLIFLHYVKK